MQTDKSDINVERDLVARLDRIPVWPHSSAVLWVVGIGYLIAFFDITNVAFGLPVFSKVLHFGHGQEAIPITASLLGYVVGAWLNSNFADAIGRKGGIATATLLFTFGCIGTTFATGLDSMVIGRFITGMGIGAEIAVISAYIGEMAPASVRGRYTGLANVFAMLGQAIVPIIALILVPNFAWGWRAMFFLGALGGFTLFAFPWLPESPRWLLSKKRLTEATNIIDAAEARARKRPRSKLLPKCMPLASPPGPSSARLLLAVLSCFSSFGSSGISAPTRGSAWGRPFSSHTALRSLTASCSCWPVQ
jgi:putative MFS transporter